ncbi:MAG: adenine deaminase [Rhodothermales bacterium]|nr:adenine deaminase [Rhodothermales bacterium]MBO6779785.1 adenine deaminase [Rhodothermales bacterium]
MTETLSGTIVDPVNRRLFPGRILIRDGRIESIQEEATAAPGFLLPGFVDAHVHIESSMLSPSQFARLAVRHGTVATVSDPHEIANVVGVPGVQWMLDDAARVPLIVAFGAPSCVPATPFEHAGAVLGPQEVAALLADPRIGYLSEMMNYPGVVAGVPDVMAKIQAAHAAGKPVDGHAPMLRGADLRTYVSAGISTDHECVSEEEAREKLSLGMKVAIREGSAARNFDALVGIMADHPGQVMLCSDDKHPDELLTGHINELVARAVAAGVDRWNALEAACVTPVRHYNLDVGLMQAGDRADFIRVEDLKDFRALETWIGGTCVARSGREQFEVARPDPINRFVQPSVSVGDFALRAESKRIRVIEAIDGAIVSGSSVREARIEDGLVVSDPRRDLLKVAVVNRYAPAPPAIGFIEGFGLQRGAIASTVAHDSHNIIAVGVDDASLVAAVKAVSRVGGGIAAVSGNQERLLALPVAGLMSTDDGEEVGQAYERIDAFAKSLGSTLSAPFMTLSFMALLVIPALKLGDRGLFDVARFDFVPLFVD